MFLCLGWLIYALVQLQKSDPSCWEPFTWQYLNYYLMLLIALTPALTLGLGIVLVICCLPCILQQVITIMRDRRLRTEMGQRVV